MKIDDWIVKHIQLLNENYRMKFEKYLIAPNESSAIETVQKIESGNFALVSHGIQEDPIFNYGNKKALELFEMEFNDFIKLPSRKSAEPVHRDERAALLKEVTENGCINNYSGIRVSSTGKRFEIKNAKVFNLVDGHGAKYGQAAYFDEWQYL